ncbi:MAG: hypothetical protein LBT00_14480, partial [Spirochaetaceae bacterium]|nr:hypothetical protein [Spirochaetaceae bacterium]
DGNRLPRLPLRYGPPLALRVLRYPPLRGQNHAVHGFVGVPQASTDGRRTEYAPARKSEAGR